MEAIVEAENRPQITIINTEIVAILNCIEPFEEDVFVVPSNSPPDNTLCSGEDLGASTTAEDNYAEQ